MSSRGPRSGPWRSRANRTQPTSPVRTRTPKRHREARAAGRGDPERTAPDQPRRFVPHAQTSSRGPRSGPWRSRANRTRPTSPVRHRTPKRHREARAAGRGDPERTAPDKPRRFVPHAQTSSRGPRSGPWRSRANRTQPTSPVRTARPNVIARPAQRAVAIQSEPHPTNLAGSYRTPKRHREARAAGRGDPERTAPNQPRRFVPHAQTSSRGPRSGPWRSRANRTRQTSPVRTARPNVIARPAQRAVAIQSEPHPTNLAGSVPHTQTSSRGPRSGPWRSRANRTQPTSPVRPARPNVIARPAQRAVAIQSEPHPTNLAGSYRTPKRHREARAAGRGDPGPTPHQPALRVRPLQTACRSAGRG